MKDEKKNQLRQKIESTKEELEKLKAMNPHGNYEEIDEFIKSMDFVLEQSSSRKYYGLIIILKLLLLVFISYILCTISVSMVFGFTHSLLNPLAPQQFIWVVPLTSLVLFLTLRGVSYASNKVDAQHSLFLIGIAYILLIIIFAFLDNLYFHICSSLDKSFLMTTTLFIVASIVDVFYTRKLYFEI